MGWWSENKIWEFFLLLLLPCVLYAWVGVQHNSCLMIWFNYVIVKRSTSMCKPERLVRWDESLLIWSRSLTRGPGLAPWPNEERSMLEKSFPVRRGASMKSLLFLKQATIARSINQNFNYNPDKSIGIQVNELEYHNLNPVDGRDRCLSHTVTTQPVKMGTGRIDPSDSWPDP